MRLTAARLAATGAALASTVAFAACGGGSSSAPSGSPQELLRDAASAVREQRTLTFSFEYTRTRADRPEAPERYGWGEGALDLAAERGRMRFELDLGAPPGSGSALEPFELRWDERWLEAELDGRSRRLARARARETGGLVGRLPDEPTALLALLERTEGARRARDETLDGRQLTVVELEVDSRTAGGLGAPAELTGAAMAGLLDDFVVEAWIDEARLPRRIVLTLELEPVSHAGRPVLPARTVRVSYDLDAYGEPVSGLEFESQAG